MLGRSMAGRIYQERPFKALRVDLRQNPERQRTLQYPIPGDSSFQPESGRKHYNPRGSVIQDLIFNQDYQQMNKLKSQFQNQYGSLNRNKNNLTIDKSYQNGQKTTRQPYKGKELQLHLQNNVISEAYLGGHFSSQLNQSHKQVTSKSQVSQNGRHNQYDSPHYFSSGKHVGMARQQSMNQILKPYEPIKRKNPYHQRIYINNSLNYDFKDQIDEIKLKSTSPSFLNSGF